MRALSHITALQYWRGCTLVPPLHYVTEDRTKRFKSKSRQVHYQSQLHRRKMTQPTDLDDHVVCPELCLLQLAPSLPLTNLVLLIDEFCGTYRINEAAPFGFEAAEPLTTTASLSRFCEKSQGMNGVKILKQALAHAVDGAASPKEAQLELLLCLPQRMGGYGLPSPRMNYHIALPKVKARKVGQQAFYCDLYWPAANLAIEYDSDLCHTAEQRIARDARRRDILDGLGVKVITVTHAQFISRAEMQRVAGKVAGILGCRVRNQPTDFANRCAQLRRSFYLQK